jgi:N-acetylglutamate synthase-like GNAT family acetyltransferase
MSVRVREATADDLDAIRGVAEAAWYAAYGGTLEPETIAAALESYYDPEIVAAGIDSEAIRFHIAEDGGEALGFASAEQTWADEVELHAVYVHPDRWGEGIGAALVERVADWAREQDVDRIACGVLADNAVGVGFFEAMGFERGIETEAEIVETRHAEYEYELEL